jgi:hypothetical protein
MRRRLIKGRQQQLARAASHRNKPTSGKTITAQPSSDTAEIITAQSPILRRLTRRAHLVRSALNASARSKSSIVTALSFPHFA